ncbi:MAG: hypothetical protein V1779_00705 [bacterium]
MTKHFLRRYKEIRKEVKNLHRLYEETKGNKKETKTNHYTPHGIRHYQAVEYLCYSLLPDRKHNHQKRISNTLLNEFKDRLIEGTDPIQSVKNFDDLYKVIDSSKIKGIGDLTIYDTAHRIGVYLNILPEKVYLHSGTLIGAKKIFGMINKKDLKKEEFPEPIKSCNLTCAEIEDLLCLYKERI